MWMTLARRWDYCSEAVICNPSLFLTVLFLSKDYQNDPRTFRVRFDPFDISFVGFRHQGASAGFPNSAHDTNRLDATKIKIK